MQIGSLLVDPHAILPEGHGEPQKALAAEAQIHLSNMVAEISKAPKEDSRICFLGASSGPEVDIGACRKVPVHNSSSIARSDHYTTCSLGTAAMR